LISPQLGERFIVRFEWSRNNAAETGVSDRAMLFTTRFQNSRHVVFGASLQNIPGRELGPDRYSGRGIVFDWRETIAIVFAAQSLSWDYPESEAAKYARGDSHSPEMLQSF